MILPLPTFHETSRPIVQPSPPSGERVARAGVFTSRRGSGEGVPRRIRYFPGGEASRSGPISWASPGRDSSPRSVESHVIRAKAGIHRAWVPAYAGTTGFVTFIPMSGPQAHGHAE